MSKNPAILSGEVNFTFAEDAALELLDIPIIPDAISASELATTANFSRIVEFFTLIKNSPLGLPM
jgi:hypothetical protein